MTASGSGESLDAKCARLHEELAVAEHQRLLSSYVASPGVDMVSGAVGPLYYAKVEAEGTMVSAMIDPGSSATIVSVEQFKEIGRCAGISVKALKLPDLVLRDYNQQPIPVGAKVELTFRWKGKEVTTPTYIRAERSRGEPCLLGTNVVIPLGLMVPYLGMEARGGQDVPGVAAGVGARVHLVDSVRVPARTAVIVKGKIEAGGCVGMPLMFNPDDRWMAGEGLQLETSLLEADSDGLVDLVVCNPEGMTKMVRDAGSVGIVEIVDEEEEEWVEDQPVVHVSFVRGEVPEKDDRRERLVQAVDICKEGGTVDGAAKLQQCVVLAADVFALDKGELGQVVDLYHTIETGDSAPVRQQPRRVPFALRPELTKMINDMLGAKVIQESSSPWASPIVLVRKKDGSLRFCADYRRLNAVTRKDVTPPY